MGKISVFFFLILLLNVYAEEQVGKKVEAGSRGLKNMLSKLREWRERRRRRVEDDSWWRELAAKWDFDVTQFSDWREWTEEIVDELHEFQASTSAEVQKRIANSIKQINKSRDRMRESLRSRAKALRGAKRKGQFTVLHHVDWQSFRLGHLKKVLRAQRQVEEAGHRYVVLYWGQNSSDNETWGGEDGHLASLRNVLPCEGRGIVFVITPTSLATFDSRHSVHHSPDTKSLTDSDSIKGPGAAYDCFQDFRATQSPIVGHRDGNATTQRPYTYWRKRCADRMATVWLDDFMSRSNGSSTTSACGADGHSPRQLEGTTPYYWLLDIETEWVGSLPRVLARWTTKKSDTQWNSIHYLACCYPARDFEGVVLRSAASMNASAEEMPEAVEIAQFDKNGVKAEEGTMGHYTLEHRDCHAELQRFSRELLGRMYRPISLEGVASRSSGNKERGHGKKSMTCGQGVAFQSAHRPESTLYSTYGPRAGLDCALTWTLAEGLLLEKAVGSLMTLAEKEGLLAADFREAVDIRTSPSARVGERVANSDAQPAQHGKCIDLSSHSGSSDEVLTCTDLSDFEADVLSYRFKEGVIESSVIKGMADFYPPLLLGRIYRDME